jgi:tRNA A37 threonylcarbamoyltransferase TsaD
VTTIVHRFLKALEIAWPDARVCASFLTAMMDHLVEKYIQAIEQVGFLLRIERTGRPKTLNKRLHEYMQK